MALYEIRTLITRNRISLISYGEFVSDLAAILAARSLLRRSETLEVWRGETLVFRTVPNSEGKTTHPNRSERQRHVRLPGWFRRTR